MSEGSWTLEDLGTRVRDALAVGYVPAGSARVRAVPDARTIRYYTTLGLVDRPDLRGRTALYGRRHLLQLVAIKRLQAEGLSLDEVQARLAGLPPARLEEVAKLPPAEAAREPSSDTTSDPPRPGDGPGSRRGAFWRTLPPAPVDLAEADAASPVAAAPAVDEDRDLEEGAVRLDGLALAPGVRLVIDAPPRRLDVEDLRAIRRAADALLGVIETRGLRPRTRRGEA